MPRPLMTVERVVGILAETPDRLRILAGGATEAQLAEPPQPGEWSAVEVLAHLRACADVWGGAIETILADDHPTIRAVNPRTFVKRTDYPSLEFGPSLQAFTAQRAHQTALLARLDATDWSRSATLLGGGAPLEATVHSYAHRMARHERAHWRQLAKTLAPHRC